MTTLRDQLAEALCSDRPSVSLGLAVQTLVAEGKDRDALYRELEDLRERTLAAGRDSDDDAILDVMDRLTGWCGPTRASDPV